MKEARRQERRETFRDSAIQAVARSTGYGAKTGFRKWLETAGIMERIEMTEEEIRQRKQAAHVKAQQIWRMDK